MKPVTVLANYFGRLPGQSLSAFVKEVKELSDSDKAELVKLAAAELNVDVD